MSRQGIWSIKVRTTDTDVVMIAIALFSRLNFNKLWAAFGTGNKVFYTVHLICNNLRSEKYKTPFIYWMRPRVLYQHVQKESCVENMEKLPRSN